MVVVTIIPPRSPASVPLLLDVEESREAEEEVDAAEGLLGVDGLPLDEREEVLFVPLVLLIVPLVDVAC